MTQDRQGWKHKVRKKERDEARDRVNVWAWRVTQQSRCIKGNAPPSIYTHTRLPLHCQHSSKHAFSESVWSVNGEREGWARAKEARSVQVYFALLKTLKLHCLTKKQNHHTLFTLNTAHIHHDIISKSFCSIQSCINFSSRSCIDDGTPTSINWSVSQIIGPGKYRPMSALIPAD